MKKLMVLFGILLLYSTGCQDDVSNASAFPLETIDDSYKNSETITLTQQTDLIPYLESIFGDDKDKWPKDIKDNHVLIFMSMGTDNPVQITAETYQKVNEVVFYEYCSWYEPNSVLTITLSSVNEVSVSESITKSVGASIGHGGIGLNASISKQTTETVTTANGIQVSTSYDLNTYNQEMLYKVVLVGNYTCVTYTFEGKIVPGGDFKYVEDGIKVDLGSLGVRLVYKEK